MLVLFVLLHLAACEFFGTWHPRVANWNTGRLYFADSYGKTISSYGPVCQGTREEAIKGENGEIFGNVVCKELGFGNSAFVGLHREYVTFMQRNAYSGYNATLFDETKYCTPDYKISGAKCKPGHQTLKQGVSLSRLTFFYM